MNKSLLEKYAPVNNACLLVLAITSLIVLLYYVKAVLLPLVIALCISIIANTIATMAEQKFKVPKIVGLSLFLILFLSFLVLSVLFVSSSIGGFIESAGIYSERLKDALDWFILTAQKLGLKVDDVIIMEYYNKIPFLSILQTMGSNVFSFITNSFLVSLFVIFLFMGDAKTKQKSKFVLNIEKNVSYYLIVKIGVSLIAAICVWVVLAVVKTDLAFMFAFLTFALNFIPNVGPAIATVLPLPVLFLQYGFDWQIILALFLMATIHFIVGNILETKWLGKSMDLNPLVVIASLIFWSLLWGVMGALLAVPLTSVIKMILEINDTTKPIAKMMAGNN